MPPALTPYKKKNEVTEQNSYYLRMLEPLSDAELGGKLAIGRIVRVKESVARRWVEDIGVAEVTTKEAYEAQVEERVEASRKRREDLANPRFNRGLNANQTNANFAALSRDPSAFDPSVLPKRDPAAQAEAERRGAAGRTGQRTTGQTLEEQLAQLDAVEMAKGNIPVSPGVRGDEFLHEGQSSTGNVRQLGPVVHPNVGTPINAPVFVDPNTVDDGDDGDEGDLSLEGDDEPTGETPPQTGAQGKSGKGSK